MVSFQEASYAVMAWLAKNKMKFININRRILDYDCYMEEVSLMNKIIAADLKEYLTKLGFVVVNKKRNSYNNFKIVLYSHLLDLEITITANKKTEEIFE